MVNKFGFSSIGEGASSPCADGVAFNSDNSTQINVPSGGSEPIPDSQFDINGAPIGNVISAKTTGVNLVDQDNNTITPSGIITNGNKFDIEISTETNLITTDRFANVLPTIIVTPTNNSSNWNSYDYCDFYLSKLTNPPTGAEEAALYTAYDDLLIAGILQKSTGGIWFIRGGNAADHSWNGAYPFDNNYAFYLQYVGSPTHNANGISTNGINSGIITRVNSSMFPFASKQISVYKRNTTSIVSASGIAFGFNLATTAGIFYRPNVGGNADGSTEGGIITQLGGATANDGLISLRKTAVGNFLRNGSIVGSGSASSEYFGSFAIGGNAATSSFMSAFSPVDCAYIRIGEALSDTQETDHYNIVQALQTAWGRQV